MSDDYWAMIDEAARLARDGVRRGLRPSEVVRLLVPYFDSKNWITNPVLLTAVGGHAFELTIAECKGAPTVRWDTEAADFDGYFAPLIERNRPRWDVARDPHSRG